MKKIVVAVEFDEELDDIIKFTIDLLEGKKTEVLVVHAYESHSVMLDYAPYLVDAVEDYEEYLQQQANTVRGIVRKLMAGSVKAHGFMKPVNGSIPKSIIEFAEEKEAELVVVGTHHPNRIERLLLGSITEKVVRDSDIPVAVVPRSESRKA